MGSTGSIGTSALDVVRHNNAQSEPRIRFEIDTLAAGGRVEDLAQQAKAFGAKQAVIADESRLPELESLLEGTEVVADGGVDAVNAAAARDCDLVLAAIVGSAGLSSTLAAVSAGNDVAIANKESIVSGGHVIKRAAEKSGAKILPVDSEHNAIFQVLASRDGLSKLTITASGGPFRTSPIEEMSGATPQQAAAHPNWDMGIKNSIDSATLMNKALEFIEASVLFDVPPAQIEVLVHPQSIIHGMAHFCDGSVLAQLSAPDMKCPISYALGWPDRVPTAVAPLDLTKIGQMEFYAVDSTRFPAIGLAREALRLGYGGSTVLNSSNEAAVSAFITGQCGFLDISWVVEEALERFSSGNLASMACETLDEIAHLDRYGRQMTAELLEKARARAGG